MNKRHKGRINQIVPTTVYINPTLQGMWIVAGPVDIRLRNFGQNSNGKVHFGFFLPEYLGSPLEVVHIFRSEYSDQNSSSIFDKQVL